MKVSRLRNLCIEIYKIINNINQNFMKNIFNIEKQKELPIKVKSRYHKSQSN